jgi:hypothetical protein
VLDQLDALAEKPNGAAPASSNAFPGHKVFARLATANLHYYSAPAPNERRRDDGAARAEHRFSHALELYRRVLKDSDGESNVLF